MTPRNDAEPRVFETKRVIREVLERGINLTKERFS